MVNNYTNVLKSQRVNQRKQTSYTVEGNTVLKKQLDVPIKRSSPVIKAVALRSAEPMSFYQPHAAQKKIVDTDVENVKKAEGEALYQPERVKKPFSISPQLLLVVFAIVAVGFFAYNALLWQNDDYLVEPPAEPGIRQQMMDFIAGNEGSVANTETLPDRLPISTSDMFDWQYYTVQKGDSVSKIASAHSLSMDAVIASNNMRNARAIREGDVLRIPNMDGIPYTAARGDGYESIAEKFAVPLNAILDANDVQSSELLTGTQLFIPGARMRSEDLKLALGELFIYPVRGRISSSFGWRKDPFTGERRYHSALDIAADTGVPVKASMDGKVNTCGFSPVFGNYIIVAHNGGYQTMYAHLNKISTIQGTKVRQGEKLGEVGNTGQSTGSHLHFAVYKNGRAVNPLDLLKLQ